MYAQVARQAVDGEPAGVTLFEPVNIASISESILGVAIKPVVNPMVSILAR